MASPDEPFIPRGVTQPSLLSDNLNQVSQIDSVDESSKEGAALDQGDKTEVSVGPTRTRRSGNAPRRSPARPKRQNRSELDPGTELERRVGRLEFAEGALVRLRVPVRVDAANGRDVMTDLDVLAIDIDLRLRLSRSILECKTTVGEAGEPDRLLWLSGLSNFVSANRAVLVRPTVSRRGRAVAEKLGVHVLDIAKLEALEAAHAWLPDQFAHLGGIACAQAEKRVSSQLKGSFHLIPELFQFLRDDALLASPHQIVSALNALGNQVSKGFQLPEPARTVLASHSLIALLIAATVDAQELDVLTSAEVRRRLELTLTLGNANDEILLELFSSADALMNHFINQVHEGYRTQGAARVDVTVPSLRELISEPPAWIPRYLDLIELMRANPSIARDILQTTELSCFEALLGGDAYKNRAFDHLFTVEHRQLLRVALRTLKTIIGPDLADTLGQGFARIDFGRVPPELPDRRSSPTTIDSSPTELAKE